MGKTDKKKSGKVAMDVKVETKKSKREKFVWPFWDSLLFDFLTAVHEAGIESRQNKTNFEEILSIELRSNADLVAKVKANPKLAQRIINSLPCGHRVCYEFIREVSQMH